MNIKLYFSIEFIAENNILRNILRLKYFRLKHGTLKQGHIINNFKLLLKYSAQQSLPLFLSNNFFFFEDERKLTLKLTGILCLYANTV